MRAGRKRKTNADRYPCGKVRPSPEELARRMEPRNETVDPTPEIIAMRIAAFGDPKATGELCCPIDRLKARLTEDQYYAGRYARTVYARYCIAIGVPRLVSGQLTDYIQGGGGSPMDHEQAMDAVAHYQDAILAIQRYSRRSLREVQRIMHGAQPRSFDALAVGLTALADHMGLSRRKAA